MDRTAEGKGGKLLRTALCTAALVSVFVMTAASERVSAGATSAMKLCVKSLIPAIFPFLVLNGILVRCGFPEKAGKPGMPRKQDGYGRKKGTMESERIKLARFLL